MRSALFLVVLAVTACEPRDPCDGVRDLTLSPAGLELTNDEHAIGWGNTECFQCHQSFNIHVETCIGVDGVAVGLVDETYVDLEDTSSCVRCHGANGVDAWALDSGEDR